MKGYFRNGIVKLLARGRVALGNAAQTPEIVDLFERYGYGAPKLQEGQTLLQALEDKHAAQLHLYARQKEATAAFRAARQAGREIYHRHVRIARILLIRQPERLARLGLDKPRANAFSAWLAQAQQFYREALADADLQALLAEGGLTQAVLTSGQMAIEAVVQAHAHKESAKGLAQQATQDRNAAAAELDQWLRHFWKIAEVALADQPQWLERLGRRVRS